jgi:hypothetical protein
MTIQLDRKHFTQAVVAEAGSASDALAVLIDNAAAEVAEVQPARKEEQRAEAEEPMQVAQLDAAALQPAALAGESISDLGEAGLVGLEEGAGWEAQDVAYAGAAGGAAGGFWGGLGGFGAGAAGIALYGKGPGEAGGGQPSPTTPTTPTTPAIDTNVVVFDLRTGVSSDHSQRMIDPTVSYDIYIITDQNADISTLSLANGMAWSGGGNLGSDDTIHLVLSTGAASWATRTRTRTYTNTFTHSASYNWTGPGILSAARDRTTTVRAATEAGTFVWYAAYLSLSVVTTTVGVTKHTTGSNTRVTLIAGGGTGGSVWSVTAGNWQIHTAVPVGLLTSQGLV